MNTLKTFILQRTALTEEVCELGRIVARAFPGAPNPTYANDEFQLLVALQAQLQDCEVMLVAVEADRARICCKHLLAAMEIPAVVRTEVLARQASPCPEDALFPAEAELFHTLDGRDTGFSLKCGGQCLVFLPLRLASLAELGPALYDCLDRLRSEEAQPKQAANATPVNDASAVFERISAPFSRFAPILPDAIIPGGASHGESEEAADAHSAAAEYFPQSGALGGTPPPPFAQAPPLAEIVRLRTRRADMAKTVSSLLTLARQLSGRRCLLALPTEWREIAPLLRELGVPDSIHAVQLAPEATILTPEDAVRYSKRFLTREPDALCGVISAPLPAQNGAQLIYLAAGSAQEYAQVRQLELEPGEAPAECAAGVAEALLRLLCDHLETKGLPPREARILALQESPAPLKRTNKRHRAAAASCLALATVVASVYLTFQSPQGRALESTVSSTQTIVAQEYALDEPLLEAIHWVSEARNDLAQLPALQLDSTAPGDSAWLQLLQRMLRLGGDLFTALLGYIQTQDTIPWPSLPLPTLPAATTTAATTASTTKATTTATTTTTKATTAPTTTPAAKGTFLFSVRGYGHGVGMSQEGAKAYALQGWKYSEILLHYYFAPKITLEKDKTTPLTVIHEGAVYTLTEYLGRVTCGEIGYPSSVADEAFKAQVICAYTMAKQKGFNTKEGNQHLIADADWNGTWEKKQHAKVLELVNSVLGRYVAYDGAIAETLYFDSTAGRTTNAAYVWGGTAKPYLQGGRESIEVVDTSTRSFTQQEIRNYVATYNSNNPGKEITLGSDPATWFGDATYDAAGYVQTIRVGNRTLIGGEVRSKLFGSKVIRSHCFTVAFGQ
jgi:SpoIID/LytB domain protein